MVTSWMARLSLVAMLYVSPCGKTTVPPLLQSLKAARIWGTSSCPFPSGLMVQVLDGSARGRSGDRNWSVDAVQPKWVNEAKRRRNFEADMVLARERNLSATQRSTGILLHSLHEVLSSLF